MPLSSYAYNGATAALQPVLKDFGPVLVAIDGRLGSGKTTLGRYLAWHFNITLIETDLFLKVGKGFLYRQGELQRVVAGRIGRGKPVLVEGAAMGWLLPKLGYEFDFSLYVHNTGPASRDNAHEHIESYESACQPLQRANFVVELSH